MKPIDLFIVLSLAANALLACVWLIGRASPRGADPMTGAVALSLRTSPAPVSPEPAQPRVPNASSATPVPSPTAGSWKDLQTDDLKEHIRRLRAVDCPEETVQDIILAEVNRRYAVRSRELWPERYAMKPFWEVEKNDPVESRKNRERMRQDRELRKEKSALLVDLFGVDLERERRKADGLAEFVDYNERRVSFLPEAKREAVAGLLDEFEDKMQDFYSRNRGMYDAQYRAEQRQLETERAQALAQFLTPQELREFELRQTQLASQLSHDLRALSVTREQYEAIFDIRKKYGDGIYNYADIETKEARDQVARNKEAMQAEMAVALGRDKAREYERSQDYSYQQLDRLAQRYDLPADTAAKVYDFKEAAEAGAKQIKADLSLTDPQRQDALRKIRDETQQAVKEALGAGNYTNYLREGGWWINSLAPTPSRRR